MLLKDVISDCSLTPAAGKPMVMSWLTVVKLKLYVMPVIFISHGGRGFAWHDNTAWHETARCVSLAYSYSHLRYMW